MLKSFLKIYTIILSNYSAKYAKAYEMVKESREIHPCPVYLM